VLEYYFDPLPTNCVADWVCAGSQRKGEYNLAVFLGACSFDCLFCQNIQYRRITKSPRWRMAPEDLAGSVRLDTACICYFGGDPSPQLPFALKASELALDIGRDRKLHICWETNGSMHPGLLRKAVEQSLRSGGCVKFDLKAYDERLHIALCGVSNKITLSNFSWVASRYGRREPPLLIASTLLVPGYVEADEVERIARFIASCDQEIPYSLLAFYPCHLMQDMPVTSKRQAGECLQAAREAGLKRVRLGNVHLLR
jgi:pyruvate formate lyase activating enzyme